LADPAALVQLLADGSTATLQLHDPKHFNTFSSGLGADMRHAVQHVCSLPGLASVVLQGVGPHFSAGGNPYALSEAFMTPAGFAISLRELYSGFLQLRTVPHPVVGAVHGTLVGGGVAACLHADCLVADTGSIFEHGNLVRGLCVLGMLSQTFTTALGPYAQHAYLQNARLDAATALAAGLVHRLRTGINATKAHAWDVARLAARSNDLIGSVVRRRIGINLAVLASEAVGHVECQISNGVHQLGPSRGLITPFSSRDTSHRGLC